jgi:hypothetical protein
LSLSVHAILHVPSRQRFCSSHPSFVRFHANPDKLQLFSCADDYKVRMWDLNTSK